MLLYLPQFTFRLKVLKNLGNIKRYSFDYKYYFLLWCFGVSGSFPAIALDCIGDQQIKPVSGQLGYQPRGELCEGLYESKISADFELVSLLSTSVPKFNDTDTFLIQAPKINSIKEIGITALSLKPRLYYRMDAQLKHPDKIHWPTKQVLSKVKLNAEDIGVFGWTHVAADTIYIPLTISLKNIATTATDFSALHIALRAGVNVEYLVWHLISDGAIGQENLIDQEFAAGESIGFQFTVPSTSGSTFKIQIDAKPESSDDWLTQTLSISAVFDD